MLSPRLKFLVLMLLPLPLNAQGATACDLATAGLRNWALSHGAKAEVHCRMSHSSNSNALEAKSMAAPSIEPGSGPRLWPIAVREGASLRTVQVPLWVRWTSRVWVTTRGVAAGERLGHENVAVELREWPEFMDLIEAEQGQPLIGVASRQLVASRLLTRKDLRPIDEMARGARVLLVLQAEGIAIERPALLMHAARVGQAVRVQLDGSREVIVGRLVASNIVELEHL